MKQSTDLQPRVVLGVGAHPDDLDAWAGGTIAKWAAAGAEVYYLILTGGGKGTADPALSGQKLITTRQLEQRAAAESLGVREVYFAKFEDGALMNTTEVQREIVFYIRKTKPDVVVGWDPSFLYSAAAGLINHPDHRAAGQATLDAVYPMARDELSFPELAAQGYAPHKVASVLLIRADEPNYMSDIAEVAQQKRAALAMHMSQANLDEVGQILGHKENFMRIDLRF